MPARKSTKTPVIYQLKITLQDIRPPIWRRILVPSNIHLGVLHDVIQTAMGWTDSHLHQFTINQVDYGVPMPEYDDDEFEVKDESQVKLSQVIPGESFMFLYHYDFGDCWDHDVLVEAVLPFDPEAQYPVCLMGKRACPPEDCGGVGGYMNLLTVLQDPSHYDYEDLLEWVGDEFNPAVFDLEETNQVLAEFSRYPR